MPMYPTAVGTSFIVQHRITGSGRFFGTEYGRARVTMTNGDANAEVRVAARLYGELANALSVEFVDRGSGIAVTATYVEQIGTAIKVYLRRLSSGAPLASSSEVAGAINAYGTYTGVPISAIAGGNGAGLCTVLTPTLLTGGRNPLGYPVSNTWSTLTTYAIDVDVTYAGGLYRSLQAGNQGNTPSTSPSYWLPMAAQDNVTYRWQRADDDLGFFHFEQNETLIVRQFEAVFTVPAGTHRVALVRCPLNTAYEPVLEEGVGVFRYESLVTSAPDIAVSDVRIVLPKNWCFLVLTDVAMPGTVRIDVRREANFPYL